MKSQMLSSQLSHLIANQIYNELTTHMDYKSQKLKYQANRDHKARQLSLQYTHAAFDNIHNLMNIEPEQNVIKQVIKTDAIEKNKQFGLGKRVSIMKIRRSIMIHKKNSVGHGGRGSKKYSKNYRQNAKGLIKLTQQQQDSPTLIQYIQKLRQKKQKFAQVMQEFTKQSKQNMRQFRSTFRETSYNSERPFITSLTGEVIKCQKKEQNSKKDEIYLQKVKIKPLFKLRQHVSSRRDLFKNGQIITQTKRNSILKPGSTEQQELQVSKDDNYYIKSIIDVIANKKNLENVRRRRNNNIR